ncbi:hypothetical protein K469DRAFT_733407 [Zopfia rhizophila CBS 207.26]|uniref:C2H2-type domain-containing protein n=1 Tax=Zopfia rhizophila CBS 207.26 TaxID=1314779 RepID=A0A6A6EKW6_9PEZI|nr:hypothetical protein K469DRAFT_733407 [Zopfia rhizophila CBS 207.26]
MLHKAFEKLFGCPLFEVVGSSGSRNLFLRMPSAEIRQGVNGAGALRRNYVTLKLWTDGHGVSSGKLDHILENSKSLQYTMLATLHSSAEFSHMQFDTNGGSSEDEENYNIDDVVEDIKTYTQCLVDLSGALECPATDPEYHDHVPAIPRLEKRGGRDYYADLIIAKYPKASLKLRMQVERRNNANVSAADEIEVQARSVTSKLHLTQSSTWAKTIISFMSSISGGSRAQIPSLPAEAKNGQYFECSACGKYIRARTNREKHLYNGLQPYTWFYLSCGFSGTSFRDRDVWSTHLELDHGNGTSVILIHLARHMEDIALATLPCGLTRS